MARSDTLNPNNTGQNYNSFAEFWPYYLAEHAQAANRKVHVAGTTLATFSLCYALLSECYTFLWLAPLIGYGFAWSGHFFIEKNRPATFHYPLYSLLGDFKMCALTYMGMMGSELQKHNITPTNQNF